MKQTLLAAAAVVAFLVAPASAAPLAVTKDVGAAIAIDSAAEAVHFNHRTCQLSRFGWHSHRFGDRIACRPFSRARSYDWRLRRYR